MAMQQPALLICGRRCSQKTGCLWSWSLNRRVANWESVLFCSKSTKREAEDEDTRGEAEMVAEAKKVCGRQGCHWNRGSHGCPVFKTCTFTFHVLCMSTVSHICSKVVLWYAYLSCFLALSVLCFTSCPKDSHHISNMLLLMVNAQKINIHAVYYSMYSCTFDDIFKYTFRKCIYDFNDDRTTDFKFASGSSGTI